MTEPGIAHAVKAEFFLLPKHPFILSLSFLLKILRFIRVLRSKFSELDSDNVKQRILCFLFRQKSAWYCFMAFVLLFYVICVRYAK